MSKNIIPIKINIIAVGNYGCNVVKRLGKLGSKDIMRSAISVSGSIFDNLKIKNKVEIPFDNKIKEGRDKSLIREMLKQKQEEIVSLLNNMDVIFLVGNLANEITVYQVQEISRLAKEKGCLVFFVSSTSFPFEGQNKMKTIQKMKMEVEKVVDGLLVIDNEKIMNQKISAVEALSKMDETIADMISNIINVISKCGVINVDFADLKNTINNAGEIFFNSALTDKKDINLLINQLFSETNLISSSNNLNKVLYVIYAGKDILMDEVNEIGKKIQEKLSDSARIIFGVVNDESFKDKLKITMIGV